MPDPKMGRLGTRHPLRICLVGADCGFRPPVKAASHTGISRANDVERQQGVGPIYGPANLRFCRARRVNKGQLPLAFAVTSLKDSSAVKREASSDELTNGHSVLQPSDSGGRDTNHVAGQDQRAPGHLAYCLHLGVLERRGHCRREARFPKS